MTVASGGNGTPAHLAAELFAQQAQLQARIVPFNGAAPGVNAVVAGHVQMMFAAAPTGTSPERIERVARAVDKVLAGAAVRQALASAGLEPVAHSTPDDFRAWIALEVGRWGDIVRRSGISLQ